MAPNWIITVKAFTNGVLSIPSTLWAIIMCPVEDTGRNSVSPSTIAMITVCNQSMGVCYFSVLASVAMSAVLLSFLFEGKSIATIMNTNPMKLIAGATLMRRAEKMSGLKRAVSLISMIIESPNGRWRAGKI